MKKLTTHILILFTLANAYSQPCTKVKEHKRKQYHVDGAIKQHPYTIFDRHNGLTFQETVINIRKRIIEEKTKDIKDAPIFTAYKKVYEFAESTKPTDDGLGPKGDDGKYTGISSLATWAKCNAFVFLIGLDANENKFDVLSSMFEVIQTHFPFLKTQLS